MRIEIVELRREWEQLTRGRQLRIDPLTGHKGLLEAFKYALKPQELLPGGGIDLEALRWRFLAFQGLKGRRLIRTFGIYHGLDTEPDITQPEPDQEGESLDLVGFWIQSANYYLVKELRQCLTPQIDTATPAGSATDNLPGMMAQA
jgi:hypothetical protein